ncbi:MAG: trypsin-like peptidase domain-containing protein [Caldilineaceae bacterium]|nr:trypsin-like peptidase domain-containing protein [Caldilineaceae bacterium]
MQSKKLLIKLVCLIPILLSACWGSSQQIATTPTPSAFAVTVDSTLVENLSEMSNAAASPTPRPSPTAIPTPATLSIDGVYQKLKSSTVYIYANTTDGASTGTGIIYTADGYVVTNAHVIHHATNVRVYREGSKTSLAAKIIGISYCDDLAVLDIAGDGFEPAVFGDSDALKRGETVVAIGYPLSNELGVDLTVASGEVNRLNARVENLESAIQTDAPINPGNSGGPLANLRGEVIGINTTRINATSTGQRVSGVSFAIASNFATTVRSQLETGKNLYWTGFEFQRDELAKRWMVTQVENSSPAQAIGIVENDVVVSIAGQKFSTPYEACRLLKDADYEAQSVEFELMRGQQKLRGKMGKHISRHMLPPLSQKMTRTTELSEPELMKLIGQNGYITDVGYGDSWILVFSQDAGYSSQVVHMVDSYSTLEEVIESHSGADYAVTDLTYGNGKWIVVLSEGSGYTDQQLVAGRFFPEDDVNALLTNGYAVTSAVSGGGRWIVILSKNSGNSEQQYEFVDTDQLSIKLTELNAGGQYVSLLVPSDGYLGDTWLINHFWGELYPKQKHLVTPIVNDDVIDTLTGGKTPTVDTIQMLNGEWVIIHR